MSGSGEPNGPCAHAHPTDEQSDQPGAWRFRPGTLTTGAQQQAQYALLAALKDLLDAAAEAVWDLRDAGLDKSPLCVDARPLFDWINETVEALDALGWKDIIEAENARLDAKR